MQRLLFLLCIMMGLQPGDDLQAAVITVNSVESNNPVAEDGFCTLQEAVEATNSNLASGVSSGECAAGEPFPVIDEIHFSIDILPASVIVPTALELTESVAVVGPHQDLLTLQGIGLDRVMVIDNLAVASFSVSDLTINGGFAGIGTSPDNMGGGMLVSLASSDLLLERVTFKNNYAEYAGGALAIGYGGTVNNVITISHCTFDDNSSIGTVLQPNGNTGGGGAIFIGAFQTVEVINSTFTANRALNQAVPLPSGDAYGGAIWMLSSSPTATSTLAVDSSTFDDNSANGVGGAISIGGPGFPTDVSEVAIKHSTFTRNTADANFSDTGHAGGGIYSSSSVPIGIFNNVIARNTDHSTTSRPNLSGSFNSIGHNFINGNQGISGAFPMGSPNVNDDFVVPGVGTPGLEPLADNGGPTLTRAIEFDSPLIDQGKCGNKLSDQRGHHEDLLMTRAVDDPAVTDFAGSCDIGAFERNALSIDPEPMAVNDLYSVLEDHTLNALDANGQQTPADSTDDGLLANDLDDDVLWVTSAGLQNLNTLDMDDAGQINLQADGTFSYTPPADENGQAFSVYHISDRMNRDQVSFGITVVPVNDPPSFEVDGSTLFNISSNDPPPITDENWAINISPGAANESNQQLTFGVTYTVGDASFFISPPTVDVQTGDLNFEVADDATGSVSLLIYLQDNGDTDNGGSNISPSEMVTINRTIPDVIFADNFDGSAGSN
ncbi:choice-of-anchor Q domain-containing protein [Marinicella sediminis]|nr:choice-of-anchor Q domain-containing protein [Marinicella sediminis]